MNWLECLNGAWRVGVLLALVFVGLQIGRVAGAMDDVAQAVQSNDGGNIAQALDSIETDLTLIQNSMP